MTRAEKICRAIEHLWDCCEEIKENGRCGSGCPMHTTCLDETSFVEVADLIYEENVTNFIRYAEG